VLCCAVIQVAPISPKWPPTVSADATCIPAAHNIHLSPRDTGFTIFSSVTSLATPQAAEAAAAAVTAAAAAAEAAAGRLKSVMPAAAVPESLLTAAEQRVKTLVAIEAVRSCRWVQKALQTPSCPHLQSEILGFYGSRVLGFMVEVLGLRSVMPAASGPESLLTAAEQRVTTLVDIEAVRSCR
jgi:hypothetical protein